MKVSRFHPALPLALLVAASACVPRAPETPESTPTPSPPQPEPSAAPVFVPTPSFDNWMDAPQTSGDWSYRETAGWTEALFGERNTEAKLVLRCMRGSGTVTIIRPGNATGPVPMRIRTETRDQVVTAQPTGGQLPTLVAVIPAQDSLWEAIIFSKGRFALETPGLETLYVPSWPEITRVVEDCR